MKHLLITDDDHFITRILKQKFESTGLHVSLANTGGEAIRFIRDTKPDAILLDLGLPDMSGVEVLEFIRSRNETKTIPVIVISNSPCFSGIVQAAWSAGATKFINKEECDIKEIIAEVDSFLNPHNPTQAADTPPPEIVNYSILLADDDVVIHGVLEFFLRQAGFAVISAFDGRQALEMAAHSPPDLIILDGLMPELDGFHVMEKIKQDPDLSKIPVIMMTSEKDDSLRENMTGLGVVEYLVKPLNIKHLVKLVEKHITRQIVNL